MSDLSNRGAPGYLNPESFGGIIYGRDGVAFRRVCVLLVLVTILVFAVGWTAGVIVPPA
ncbi:hypothetical protein [Pseudonocardia sp. NPDC049635]|uniref:hypothetical protein n=1 Tax=Pseudonocardia sp. NPDC049635 TaxID=3155506 RepID=UPI003401AC16